MLPNQLFIWEQLEVINRTDKFKTNYDISRNCDRIFGVVGRLGTGKIKEIYFDCLGRHEIVTFIKARKPYLKSTEGKKVKFTLLQALRLCTGRTAHRGSRGIALCFHDHGTRRG
jgi:hypothetical protein